jgi:hypothetical protein
MNILTVITPSHQRLYQEFFLKNLPADATVLEKHLPTSGDGGYISTGWQDAVTAKLRWAVEHLSNTEPGALFVLSDVDILLYPSLSMTELEREIITPNLDIVFQRETSAPDCHEANTGFYIARNGPYVRNLLTTALEICNQSETKNDQTAINSILALADFNVRWGLLPTRYYARSQGYPPPRSIVLHHANCAASVDQKVSQLRRIEKYNHTRSGRAVLMLIELWERASGKLKRMLRQRLGG